MKISVTLLLLIHAERFPDCIETGFLIRSDVPVLKIHVVDFLAEGATGEVIDDKFTVLSIEACSRVCGRIEMCDWWSVYNGTLCSLYNTNGTRTVSGMRVNSTDVVGHRSCSLLTWPSCIRQDVFVSGLGYSELWLNATAIFGFPRNHESCYNSDCHLTDRFFVSSVLSCATVCSRYPGCAHFSFDANKDSQQCWLRRAQFRNSTLSGFLSGDVMCALDSPYMWPAPLSEF